MGVHPNINHKQGSALVMTLVVVVVLTLASIAIISTQVMTSKATSASFDDSKAEMLVQAAVSEAIVAIRGGSFGGVGTEASPARLGDGLFWVETTDLGSGRYHLYAIAAVGAGRAASEVVVNVGGDEGPVFTSTLNSDEPLTLNEGVTTDSYNSADGTYDSQAVNVTNGITHANTEGDMSSNNDVVMNARATVLGDATPGPGHTVTYGTDAYVEGSTLPASEEYAFPPVEVPNVPVSGDFLVPSAGNVSLSPGVYGYSNFEIGKDAVLTIHGPATVVVDDFSGIKDSQLVIDAVDGPVTFYIQGTYFHDRGFEALAESGSPLALAFFIASSADIAFPSDTNIRGAYYAPESHISFASGNEAWGSFAGSRVSMSSGMRFHYDEDLAEHWEDDTGQGEDEMGYVMWIPARISIDALRANRGDPFALLGVDRGNLRSPADAWLP
jgi:hypothetical protein